MITGILNNTAEILAVLVILPTLFTFFSLAEAIELTKSGNTGLTFIALPELFAQLNFGRGFAILFFTALLFAAFTSLIAMFELGISFLGDLGWPRKKAVFILSLAAIVLGAPSATNMNFFDNQDWVWGIGLLLSGFFFTVLVRRIGADQFIKNFVGIRSKLGQICLKILIYWVIPIEFFALIIWWFYQAFTWDPEGWLNPFKTFSVGTCLLQWGLLMFILLLFNRKLSQKIQN